MVLAGALCATLASATGITNKSPRALMTGLLHAPYSPGQMTYDLRRLRLAGLIRRLDHADRYFHTPDGIKVAVFYTKLHNRLPRARCWPPSSLKPPPSYAMPCTSSTSTSATTSRAPLGRAA
ncbi:MAG TPA: hypothetical protein VGH53_29675 [Streptosporangiaceae bacterium]|jgi:hypothetical protein